MCWFSHSNESVTTCYLLELSLTCFWMMRLNHSGWSCVPHGSWERQCLSAHLGGSGQELLLDVEPATGRPHGRAGGCSIVSDGGRTRAQSRQQGLWTPGSTSPGRPVFRAVMLFFTYFHFVRIVNVWSTRCLHAVCKQRAVLGTLHTPEND